MRFSAATFLALPLLASAVETQDPLTQAKDTALHYYNLVSSFIPHYNTWDAAEAALAKAGGKNVDVLSLSNWRSTLRSSVTPASSGPEEWWVLITGGNKTCWGQCGNMEKAFNETALLFAADPSAPHLAYINCDHQPILCNSWVTGPPALYIMEVTAEPAPVDIYIEGFNSSTVTVADFVKLHTTQSWKDSPKYEGHFHPFDGTLAKLSLAVPIAWFLFAFNVLPNWAFMILISFGSRHFMYVSPSLPFLPRSSQPRLSGPRTAN